MTLLPAGNGTEPVETNEEIKIREKFNMFLWVTELHFSFQWKCFAGNQCRTWKIL